MILRLAMRSLLARPVRSAVLIGGFGLGVAVMAVLLGVGRVILEQASAPALRGGGDVVIAGASGELANPAFILSSTLHDSALGRGVIAAAPSADADLYLLDATGATPIRARGGIPSLERALGDPETRAATDWADTPADRVWASPNADDVLREIDRFHPVPDVPARARSWAEWLYFNGRAADSRFYLTFMSGPMLPNGRRTLGVRLQLDRSGTMTSYSDSAEIDPAELVASAPDIAVGKSHVHLVGHEYQIALDLPSESGGKRAIASLVLRAEPGRSLPPFTVRGAGGWLSGYVVPVMSGTLHGSINVGADAISFDDAAGYHDHNWGFWNGVSWQWGQVQHEGVSFVYGRLHPPADAADASRVPGFVMAIGPDGPMGFATDVTIDETNSDPAGPPQRIIVRARGDSLMLTMDLHVREMTKTKMRPGSFGGDMDFLQLRADYQVTGSAGNTSFNFAALGSAETFRGGKR